jgi:hypothetical protein
MWNLGVVFGRGCGSIERAIVVKGGVIKQVVGVN